MRLALFIETGNERFAHAEFHDGLFGFDLRIRSKCFRRRLHRLLIARREGAQGVLHAITKLAENVVGNVPWVLRHEENADALRANEPDDLLDFLQQRGLNLSEQQVRFVEEKTSFGFGESPTSGWRSNNSESSHSNSVA